MKIKSIIAAFAAVIITATSCGVLGTTSRSQAATTAPAATTATTQQTGSSVGLALASLYAQYKIDGKVDMSNVNNILNLATLASNLKILKGGAAASSSFVEQFASGLISGSKNLVNKNNSAKVIDNLVALSGINLNSITSAASSISNSTAQTAGAALDKINTASSQVTSAVSTLNSIFSLLKK